jgi:hypothetical protein
VVVVPAKDATDQNFLTQASSMAGVLTALASLVVVVTQLKK